MALKSVALLAAALFITGSAAFSQVPAPACDRACLNCFVDQYLAALVAKNAMQLPLAPNARYTENGVELILDSGIWDIENKLLDHKLCFADPQHGQVRFFGTIEGHGHPSILGISLKIENRRISEMEAIVIRSTARGSFSDIEGMEKGPTRSSSSTRIAAH